DKIQERLIVCERTGCSALRTPLVEDLWSAHKDRLSIVNGVCMLPKNDGHQNNEAYLWGNTDRLNTDVFPPIIGKAVGETPLQSIVLREPNGGISATNLAGSADLRVTDLDALGQAFRDGAKIDEASPLWQYVTSRADLNAGTGGLFAAGAGNEAQGLR